MLVIQDGWLKIPSDNATRYLETFVNISAISTSFRKKTFRDFQINSTKLKFMQFVFCLDITDRYNIAAVFWNSNLPIH